MSYWGGWKCPECGKEWVGGIGWSMPRTDEEMNNLLMAICGDHPEKLDKELTQKQMDRAMVISKMSPPPPKEE